MKQTRRNTQRGGRIGGNYRSFARQIQQVRSKAMLGAGLACLGAALLAALVAFGGDEGSGIVAKVLFFVFVAASAACLAVVFLRRQRQP